MDTIRVLRVIEYVGPREAVEELISKSIHGERCYMRNGKDIVIRAATLGTYPEILNPQEESNGA